MEYDDDGPQHEVFDGGRARCVRLVSGVAAPMRGRGRADVGVCKRDGRADVATTAGIATDRPTLSSNFSYFRLLLARVMRARVLWLVRSRAATSFFRDYYIYAVW